MPSIIYLLGLMSYIDYINVPLYKVMFVNQFSLFLLDVEWFTLWTVWSNHVIFAEFLQ